VRLAAQDDLDASTKMPYHLQIMVGELRMETQLISQTIDTRPWLDALNYVM
jgi:hypothetical protein